MARLQEAPLLLSYKLSGICMLQLCWPHPKSLEPPSVTRCGLVESVPTALTPMIALRDAVSAQISSREGQRCRCTGQRRFPRLEAAGLSKRAPHR